MPKKPMPMDYEFFNDLLMYDPNAGGSCLVYRKDVMSGTRPIKAGTLAGCKNTQGYWVFGVQKKQYKAHRVVWLLHKRKDFDHQIDHINGDRSDNRIENLREATPAQNRQNMATPKHNTSGFIGVSWQKATGQWMASIMSSGRRRFLGYFNTPEEAFDAYLKAKSELHKFQPTPRST